MSQIDLIKELENLSRNFNKKNFSVREIAMLLSISVPAAAMLLIRAEKKDLVFRVKNLWINKLNQPSLQEIAFALYSPSYMSLESALFYHQCLSQSPKGRITLITSGRPQKIWTPVGNIQYFHVIKRLFYGFDAHRMAYPEKAWLDLIYLRGLQGREHIISEDIYVENLKTRKILEFARFFPPWVYDLSKKTLRKINPK